MINEHLNDEEIQQYVFQKTECNVDILDHIESCETCKIKAVQYNLLFEGIKQQDKPAFDFDIADLVVEQLPKPRQKVSNDTSFWYLIILISIFSLSIIFYVLRHSLSDLFKGITLILVALVITTALCLFVILFIDMYRNYQTKMKTLNFY